MRSNGSQRDSGVSSGEEGEVSPVPFSKIKKIRYNFRKNALIVFIYGLIFHLCSHRKCSVNPFFPNVPFWSPLKTSENLWSESIIFIFFDTGFKKCKSFDYDQHRLDKSNHVSGKQSALRFTYVIRKSFPEMLILSIEQE